MRIITWNCNMSFRKKADTILAYKPHLLIIPECEHPEKLTFSCTRRPKNVLWFGHNQNKGLGVFSFSNFRIKVLDVHNENFKTIVPLSVSSGQVNFNLFAIWANNPKDPDGHYITQVWKALHHYDGLMKNKQTILIGDFNSNTIWDKPRRQGNHSTVVEHLEKKGIHSLYHKYFKQVQGQEKHSTLYMYRHKDKGYHIDYCFASEDFANRLKSVEIGPYDFWRKYSDHAPVIVTFNRARSIAQ